MIQTIRINAEVDAENVTLMTLGGKAIAVVPRSELFVTRKLCDGAISLDPNCPWTPAINRMVKSPDAKPFPSQVSDPWDRRIGNLVSSFKCRWKRQIIGRPSRRGERCPLSKCWDSAIKRMSAGAWNNKPGPEARAKTYADKWHNWLCTVTSNHNHRNEARLYGKRNTTTDQGIA